MSSLMTTATCSLSTPSFLSQVQEDGKLTIAFRREQVSHNVRDSRGPSVLLGSPSTSVRIHKNKRALLVGGTLFLVDGRILITVILKLKSIVSRQVSVVNALRLLTESTTTHFDKYIRAKDEN